MNNRDNNRKKVVTVVTVVTREKSQVRGRKQLADAEVAALVADWLAGMGYKRLAAKYEVHRNTARMICLGKRRRGTRLHW